MLPIISSACVLLSAEADECDIGEVLTAQRADVHDVENASHDLVAELLDKRGDRVESLVGLIGDQDLKVGRGVGVRGARGRHRRDFACSVSGFATPDPRCDERARLLLTDRSAATSPTAFLIDRGGLARIPNLGDPG